MAKPVPVSPLSQQLGGQYIVEAENPTTSRGTAYFPSGALSLAAIFDLLSGTPVAKQTLRFTINAASDEDASGRLANVGSHVKLAYGRAFSQGATAADPIYRVDWITSAAKSTEESLFQIIASVQG